VITRSKLIIISVRSRFFLRDPRNLWMRVMFHLNIYMNTTMKLHHVMETSFLFV